MVETGAEEKKKGVGMEGIEENKDLILADLKAGYKQRYIIDEIMKKYELKHLLFPLLLFLGPTKEYQKHCAFYEKEKEDVVRLNWTDKKTRTLLELYRKGVCYYDIAAELGTTEHAVNAKVRDLRAHGSKDFPKRTYSRRKKAERA